MTRFVPIIRASDDTPDGWRLLKGPCYFANKLDAHGDYVDPKTLRRAVYEMMARKDWRIDLMHDGQPLGECHLVESHFVEQGQGGVWTDAQGAELEIRPGDWVTGIRVSPQVFAMVEQGQIGAFSFEGFAIPVAAGEPSPFGEF